MSVSRSLQFRYGENWVIYATARRRGQVFALPLDTEIYLTVSNASGLVVRAKITDGIGITDRANGRYLINVGRAMQEARNIQNKESRFNFEVLIRIPSEQWESVQIDGIIQMRASISSMYGALAA